MEALQILKFALKKERLNFTSGLLTTEKEMLISKDPNEAADPLAEMLNIDTKSFNTFLQSILDSDD